MIPIAIMINEVVSPFPVGYDSAIPAAPMDNKIRLIFSPPLDPA